MAIKLRLTDKLPAPTSRKMKDSGEMIAPCVFAREGVMHYLAKELSPLFDDLPATAIVRVMRTADELYKDEVIEGLKSAPITIGHPAEDVSVDNYKELAHGVLSGAPLKDKGLDNEAVLAGELCLNSAEAIKLADESDAQLSLGYDADLLRVDHADYDAVQVNIRPNHIAIVKNGRAGSNFRIGDSDAVIEQQELEAKAKADEEAQAAGETVEALTTKLADAEAKLVTMQAELDATKEALAAKEPFKFRDEDLAKHVEDVKANVAFFVQAQSFLDEDVVSLGVNGAKLAVLKKLTGKCFADRDEAYVNARYDIAIEADKDQAPASDGKLANLLGAVHQQGFKDSAPAKSAADEARERSIKRNEHKDASAN